MVTRELVSKNFKATHKTLGGRPSTILRFRLDLPVGSRRYLFSLSGYELQADDDWDDRERSSVNKLAREERGRVLFVIDKETRKTVVAIGFSHRETSNHALLIYAFATRQEPELEAVAEILAHIAKRCLHFIALAYGRPGHLLYDVRGGKEPYARSYDFQQASMRGEDIQRVGGTLMRQEEPPD